MASDVLTRLKDSKLLVVLVLLCVCVWSSLAVEFTFELPDRDRQCFYEEIKQGTRGTLEYQVRIKILEYYIYHSFNNSSICW